MGIGSAFDAAVARLEELATGLDASAISPRDAERLLHRATRLRNLADGLCIQLAPRATASGTWRRDGARTETEWLARQLGMGDGEAKGVLDTGRALDQLPATAEAVRSGKLSLHQASAVAAGAAADPASEERLLHVAGHDSLGGLRKERDRVKAAADPDAEARYRRIHRERYLRTWTDADGAGRGMWSTTADRQAMILAALAAGSKAAADAAHARGEHDSVDAYAVDALAAMAGASVHGANVPNPTRALPPKAIVRIDHTALVRGHAEAGETSEIAGVGPVPVAVIRELMDSGDMFLAAIVTKGVDVATVAHLGRRPTAFQTTALQWRDTVCRVECCKRSPTEWDHHEDWSETHETRLWDLGGFCDHHHDLKSYRGYRLGPSPLPGKVRLVPPDDS